VISVNLNGIRRMPNNARSLLSYSATSRRGDLTARMIVAGIEPSTPVREDDLS